MPIRILHTADVHLGMKFARGYALGVQESLIRARFDTLRRLVEMANSRDCELFVIAGDLFHSQSVPKKDVLRAADILKGFEGRLILVLPGNHDYVQKGEDPLWTSFRETMSEHTLLLDEPREYDLRGYDLDMIVYAAPCTSKHSNANAIGWVCECPKDDNVGYHIGIAHGSLEGLSPDFGKDYYPMSQEELLSAGVDLWLMGHTHLRWPDVETGKEARIFFPSTPEPDGFDCGHPGYAWLIDLGEEGSLSYKSRQSGCHRFLTMERNLSTEDDVEALRLLFREPGREKQLVKLKLKGRIPGAVYDERDNLLKELGESALYLEEDTSELLREITLDDIGREFTEGSFPYRILMKLSNEQENDLSLQTVYDLIKEARK